MNKDSKKLYDNLKDKFYYDLYDGIGDFALTVVLCLVILSPTLYQGYEYLEMISWFFASITTVVFLLMIYETQKLEALIILSLTPKNKMMMYNVRMSSLFSIFFMLGYYIPMAVTLIATGVIMYKHYHAVILFRE
jgi:hypothetical protein